MAHTAVSYYGTDICTRSSKSGPSVKYKMTIWIFFFCNCFCQRKPPKNGQKLISVFQFSSLSVSRVSWLCHVVRSARIYFGANASFVESYIQPGKNQFCKMWMPCCCWVFCCWGTCLLGSRLLIMEEEMSVWRASSASWWLTDAHGAQRNPILTEQQQLTNNNSNNNNNKQQPWMLPINKNKQEYQNRQ